MFDDGKLPAFHAVSALAMGSITIADRRRIADAAGTVLQVRRYVFSDRSASCGNQVTNYFRNAQRLRDM
jgi:hypothetical protein